MNIQFYHDPSQFLTEADAFLRQNPTANTMQISLALALQQPDSPYKQPPLLAIVRDADEIIATCLMTPPHALNISLLHPNADVAQTTTTLAAALHKHGWQPMGVIAVPTVAQHFAHEWAQHTNTTAHLKINERLYDLETVVPPTHVAGTMRQATTADIPLIAQWAHAFSVEALDGMGLDEALEMAERRVAAKQTFLWIVDDQPVSMASWGRPMPPRVTISLVYTPPEQRGHGYAQAVTAQLSQHLLDQGYTHCMLFTDLANPISNAIYQKIGYRPVIDMDFYTFEPTTQQHHG